MAKVFWDCAIVVRFLQIWSHWTLANHCTSLRPPLESYVKLEVFPLYHGPLRYEGPEIDWIRVFGRIQWYVVAGRLGAAHLPTYLKVVLLAPCSCRRKLVLTLGDDQKKVSLKKAEDDKLPPLGIVKWEKNGVMRNYFDRHLIFIEYSEYQIWLMSTVSRYNGSMVSHLHMGRSTLLEKDG